MRKLRVGTRGSALALCQTNWIVKELRSKHPGLEVDVRIIKTKGDKILDTPLARIGDKGFFVKELEIALLREEVDFAVHSMKDLPTEMADGLCLAAVPERVDPSDALISSGPGLADLPANACIGTSSVRRRAQLHNFRADLRFADLRGNLDTRLRKFAEGEFDGIVLAYAGLHRMGWTSCVMEKLPPEMCLPAVGQGALAVEARADAGDILDILKALDHPESRAAVLAERSLLMTLGGGCQVPIGALGAVEGGRLKLKGVIASPDGSRLVRGEVSGDLGGPEELGRELAQVLLTGGGDEILGQLHGQ